MALISGLVFFFIPSFTIWWKDYAGLDPERDHLLNAVLRRLAERAEVRDVGFLLSPQMHSLSALAFGGWSQSFIGLDRGLKLVLKRDPALFEFVILHELAHVRARDVRWTYLAISLLIGCTTVTLFVTILTAFQFLVLMMESWSNAIVRGEATIAQLDTRNNLPDFAGS